MKIILGILLLVALAYVATSATFLKLRRTTVVGVLVSGGWLGVLIGLAIGPGGLSLISRTTALEAAPVLTIGLGWIGLMIGLQLRMEILRLIPRWMIILVGADSLISMLAGGLLAWLLFSVPGASGSLAPYAAIVLVAVAFIGWPAEIRSLGAAGAGAAQLAIKLRASSGLAAPGAVAIYAFFIGSMSANGAGPELSNILSSALRLVGLILVAIILGVIARFGLRRAGDSRPDLLVIFLGVVALIAGAAVELRISPLMSAMLAGIVIGNLAGRELRRFERFILEAEHVVAVLFAIVAGVLMDAAIGVIGLALFVALAVARCVLKPTVVSVALHLTQPALNPDERRLARLGPIRQSPLALMLGVGLVLTDPSPLNQHTLTVLAAVGLTCDIVAVFAARLRAARQGENRPAAPDTPVVTRPAASFTPPNVDPGEGGRS